MAAIAPSTRTDVPAVAVFAAVAFGGAWLVATPLWLSGQGLATPGAPFLLVAMMLTPSLGVLAATALRRRWRGLGADTGITTPFRAWWRWGLLAWLAPLVLAVAAVALAAAAGVFTPDVAGLSGFREVLRAQGVPDLPIAPGTLLALQVVQVLLIGWVNVVPALGEEWGWRGWLLPRLRPLGRWPAVLAVGVAWGLWHAPVVLLGYNYPGVAPAVALLLMVVFCVVVGVLLGWLRLRSGSVWPAAIGHGFLNAVGGLPLLVVAAGTTVDTATTGLLGWTGWVVMGLAFALVAVLTWRRG